MNLIFSPNITDLEKEICQKYWELDKENNFIHTAKDLCQEYQINNTQLSKTLERCCLVHSDTIQCPKCLSPYVFKNRTDFKNTKNTSSITCRQCIQEEVQTRQQEQHRLELKRYQYLYDSADSFLSKELNYDDLTFLDKLYLLSLIKMCISEDLSYLDSVVSRLNQKLTPSQDFSAELLKHLYHNNLIQISPDSTKESIDWRENQVDGFSFYLERVRWIIPNFNGFRTNEFIEKLEKDIKNSTNDTENHQALYDIFKRSALEECLSYLTYKINEYNLNFSAGEKTRYVFNKILIDYSVSQVYYFIDKGCRDAVANYSKGTYSKKHASNTIIGSIERLAERATLENWQIKSWNRIKELPQSYLSIVIFDLILNRQDGGFYFPLNELINIRS